MAMYKAAKGTDALTFSNTLMQLQAAGRAIVQWTAGFDAVLCPALAEPPVPLGTIDTCDEGDPMAGFWRAADFTPFTPVSNLTGSPAISVPLFHDDELGLPAAAQIIGQPEGEGALLALSAQLEEARPWAERRAPVEGVPA
jgi:amidase